MRQMSMRWQVVVLGTVLSAVVGVSGCGGAGAEVSAMTKIATGTMDTLTAGEILAVEQTFLPSLALTQEQAGAIAEFLALNQVATIADAEALMQEAMADPTAVKLPPGFMDLFANIDLSGALGGLSQTTGGGGQSTQPGSQEGGMHHGAS